MHLKYYVKLSHKFTPFFIHDRTFTYLFVTYKKSSAIEFKIRDDLEIKTGSFYAERLLFGNDVIQSKVFFDIPFPIPVGIVFGYLSKKTNGPLLVFM